MTKESLKKGNDLNFQINGLTDLNQAISTRLKIVDDQSLYYLNDSSRSSIPIDPDVYISALKDQYSINLTKISDLEAEFKLL